MGKIEGIKSFWMTLIFSLASVAFILICSFLGFWYLGVLVFVVCMLSAIMLINKDEHWFKFGLYYLKASIYLSIGAIAGAKIIISYINGNDISDNIEFLLIALVSFIESIHNFVEWKYTLDRMGNNNIKPYSEKG